MEDAQDFHILAADTVGNNVRGAGYHQFARSLDASCPANTGMVFETVDRLDDSLSEAVAAVGFSRSRYSAASSRLASATRSHLTRTTLQFRKRGFDFGVARKVSSVGLAQSRPDFVNLPFVQVEICANRVGGDYRLIPCGGSSELIEPPLALCVEAYAQRFRHYRSRVARHAMQPKV
jgi:hypothetical protein